MVYTPNQPNVASHGSWVDMENLREMIDRQTDIDMWARKRCTASTIPISPQSKMTSEGPPPPLMQVSAADNQTCFFLFSPPQIIQIQSSDEEDAVNKSHTHTLQ